MSDSGPAPAVRQRRVRWWHVAAGFVVVLAGASVVAWFVLRPRLNDWARDQAVTFLSDTFDSEVELGSLDVQLGTMFRVRGRDLVLRHQGRRDVPPLIVVEAFDVWTPLPRLLGTPRVIDTVEIEGLQFNIPPRYSDDEARFPNQTPPAEKPDDDPPAPTSSPKPEVTPAPSRARKPAGVVISRLSSRDARLTIVPKEDWKPPKVWAIRTLSMTDVAPDRPMPFTAELENPLPKGIVVASGSFGPWASGEPGTTPLEGTYTLEQADLGVFKGIGGIVDAEGTFEGVLSRIVARGTSTTPDFHLDMADQPIPLTTSYTSVIDGTNGNTWLDPVHATLGETKIRASGGIVKVTRDAEGRTIDLDVAIEDGRLEDVLRLVVEAEEPLMTGGLVTNAKLLIPPGDVPVSRKIQLDGDFRLEGAQFTSDTVQGKVDELSRRAQGRPEARNVEDVLSDFSGRFRMRDGAIRFPSLRFTTQGARVQMAGAYYVDGRLDFAGNIRMSAGVSRMVTGKKRHFLRMFDPLFRRDGATEFPIHVRGSVQEPEFGVNVKKTLRQALLPGD